MPTFCYRRRVQFAETDLAGIVHFSWYFRYMEEAEHALWRSLGLHIAPAEKTVGYPRVAASCDYSGPLHFEDDVEVDVHVASVGRRSVMYRFVLRQGESTVATGTMTAVCVSTVPGQPIQSRELPEDVVARLTPLAG